MRLSDHFLAARGTIADLGGFATCMAAGLETAERFEISDEVTRACGDLIHSRPSALAAALPLCRLPYETMWLEWRGGLGKTRPTDRVAPVPERQGVLIESMQGQVGFMTFAWVHTHYKNVDNGVNISPIAIFFDWRPDAHIAATIHEAHRVFLEQMPAAMRPYCAAYIEGMEQKWHQISSPEKVSYLFTGHSDWKRFVGNEREVEAIRSMDRHLMPGLSPHGAGLVALIMSRAGNDRKVLHHFMRGWEADVQGEATFVECFLAMLNSKNPVVEHAPADLTKLNRARVRRGKPQFMSYKTTRLVLSRSQQRIADAHGISREAARQHLVRGHFKIRRTGVYWWAPFLRGDPQRGTVEREQYEVV